MPDADYQDPVAISDDECERLSTRLWDLLGEVKDIPVAAVPNEDYCDISLGRAHCPVNRSDLNSFLELFDHLHLEPGYVLDYAYLYGEWGGRPVIFSHAATCEAITSTDDFHQLSLHNIRHLTFDRTTEGFLQRALLIAVGDQFNLAWQEGFGENQLLLTLGDLERLVTDVPEHGWEDYQKKSNPNQSAFQQYMKRSGLGRAVRNMRRLTGQDAPFGDASDHAWTPEEREAHTSQRLQRLTETIHLNPTIRQIDENNAEVTYVVFETFGGLFYKSIVVTWPNSVSDPVYEPILGYSPGNY